MDILKKIVAAIIIAGILGMFIWTVIGNILGIAGVLIVLGIKKALRYFRGLKNPGRKEEKNNGEDLQEAVVIGILIVTPILMEIVRLLKD